MCASCPAIILSWVKSATVHAIADPGNAQASAKLAPMNAPLYDTARLHALADELIANIRELAVAGWTPATSSNFSQRLDDRHAAITVSGRDKGRLTRDDIMVVDFDGKAVGSDHRPSAETLLHTQLPAHRFDERGLAGAEIALESEYAALAAGAEHGGRQVGGLIRIVRLHQCAHPWSCERG